MSCPQSCCGLIPKSTYAGCYRAPGCYPFTPNWRGDPWRTEFCNRFGGIGDVGQKLCHEAEDPCGDINVPLRSLDYFTSPPMYRRGACSTQFRCKKGICEPNECHQLLTCQFGPDCCTGIPQLPADYKPKPNPYSDTICGLCVDTKQYESHTREQALQAKRCHQEEGAPSADPCADLPFQVYLADMRTEEERFADSIPGGRRPRSQVDYCLHPSRFRYLDTVHKTEYLDYFKMKPRCELNLYRTKLAIDNSRPRLTLPKDPTEKLYDLSQPLVFNARPIKWKSKGTAKTTYSVCVPGPITIGVGGADCNLPPS